MCNDAMPLCSAAKGCWEIWMGHLGAAVAIEEGVMEGMRGKSTSWQARTAVLQWLWRTARRHASKKQRGLVLAA